MVRNRGWMAWSDGRVTMRLLPAGGSTESHTKHVRKNIDLYYQSMDASERLSELVEVLRRDGRVDVAAAAAEFGTAELTIRRDLDVLVERGVARRVRGGAVNLLMRGEELPFAMRAIEAAGSKRRIAEAVAGLIADGEAVGLDSGTTVTETARALALAGGG